MHNTANPPHRRETLITLALSGLTLALLILAGYLAPSVLAAALH
ncbi:hypothetical protein [Pseudomonas kuykendallii]|nr:hypothetical protein [Pseudomonas kuykendallii]